MTNPNHQKIRIMHRRGLPFQLLGSPASQGVGLRLDLRTLWLGRRQHPRARKLLGPLWDVSMRARGANHWGVSLIGINAGVLTLGVGYRWDGPSGPALNTRDFFRSSAAHDALYRLMRWIEDGDAMKLIYSPPSGRSEDWDRISVGKRPRGWRAASDRVMKAINWIDGMGPIRRNYTLWGVRLGGDLRIWGGPERREEFTAPEKFRDQPPG